MAKDVIAELAEMTPREAAEAMRKGGLTLLPTMPDAPPAGDRSGPTRAYSAMVPRHSSDRRY
jgi:hypothetical protein